MYQKVTDSVFSRGTVLTPSTIYYGTNFSEILAMVKKKAPAIAKFRL